MSDLISRQAVIDAVHCRVELANKIEAMAMTSAIAEITRNIASLPSTDRNGHWIAEASDKILGQLDWSCSECGEGFALDIGKCPSDIGMNYCTNCGADMRGGKHE